MNVHPTIAYVSTWYLVNTAQLEHPLRMDWTVYIIRCSDDSLYTGVTTNLERRFREHSGSARGAKYFGGRKPVEIVYREDDHSRSSACKREAAIKKLDRGQKLRLIREQQNLLAGE